ncbi:hypothetical protein R3P38DRAFT_3187601 [Favolaschia claudopus]|uniref:Uncharacterized protein n=1 Tax=Favolaschia claudopus TaxID=2862362 RepID=A0AAW0C2T4_9AGAR
MENEDGNQKGTRRNEAGQSIRYERPHMRGLAAALLKVNTTVKPCSANVSAAPPKSKHPTATLVASRPPCPHAGVCTKDGWNVWDSGESDSTRGGSRRRSGFPAHRITANTVAIVVLTPRYEEPEEPVRTNPGYNGSIERTSCCAHAHNSDQRHLTSNRRSAVANQPNRSPLRASAEADLLVPLINSERGLPCSTATPPSIR